MSRTSKGMKFKIVPVCIECFFFTIFTDRLTPSVRSHFSTHLVFQKDGRQFQNFGHDFESGAKFSPGYVEMDVCFKMSHGKCVFGQNKR